MSDEMEETPKQEGEVLGQQQSAQDDAAKAFETLKKLAQFLVSSGKSADEVLSAVQEGLKTAEGAASEEAQAGKLFGLDFAK